MHPSLIEKVAAHGLSAGLRTMERMCRIDIVGQTSLLPRGESSNAIFCYWHHWAIPGFFAMRLLGHKLACLCHPAWYLSPYRSLARMRGHQVVFGSTGHNGQQALKEVATLVQQGFSTFMCPDGPSGPAGQLRLGAIHLSRATRTPIVPLRFEVSQSIQLPRWDHMCLPLPGSHVLIQIGAPLHFDALDDTAAVQQLTEQLGTIIPGTR